ncbi:alpha/beta fold hydrolase [Labedella phragmitis]|uniref:alpha/beta fold hydrolase n=1 Tax=Labedella phragmitis TaxID=2498849 RepID=UPI001FB7BEE4|nr:alpha/beta hydrolase [Labedella phragmitis]
MHVPTLVVHGGDDRVVPPAQGEWFLRALPLGESWLRPRDGHIGVLDSIPLALDWLLRHGSVPHADSSSRGGSPSL